MCSYFFRPFTTNRPITSRIFGSVPSKQQKQLWAALRLIHQHSPVNASFRPYFYYCLLDFFEFRKVDFPLLKFLDGQAATMRFIDIEKFHLSPGSTFTSLRFIYIQPRFYGFLRRRTESRLLGCVFVRQDETRATFMDFVGITHGRHRVRPRSLR